MAWQPTIIEVTKAFPRQLLQDGPTIIRQAFAMMGHDCVFPVTTRAVLALSAAFGFDLTNSELLSLITSKKFSPPRSFGLEFMWQVEDIQRLFVYLDAERRWLPGRHTERKTPEERQRDEEIANDSMAKVDYYKTISEDELRELHDATCDDAVRERIRIALSLKKQEQTA